MLNSAKIGTTKEVRFITEARRLRREKTEPQLETRI